MDQEWGEERAACSTDLDSDIYDVRQWMLDPTFNIMYRLGNNTSAYAFVMNMLWAFPAVR